MRQHRLWILLKVVGRKHIVFRSHEFLEKAPGAARRKTKCSRIVKRDWLDATSGWRTTRPSRYCRRHGPQDHERNCHQLCTSVLIRYQNRGCSTKCDATCHALVKSPKVEAS